MTQGPEVCSNGHPVAETDRYCEVCGTLARCENGHPVTDAAARFCEVCGVALPAGARPNPLLTSMPLFLILASVGVVIVAALAAYFFVLSGGDDDDAPAVSDETRTPTAAAETASADPRETAEASATPEASESPATSDATPSETPEASETQPPSATATNAPAPTATSQPPTATRTTSPPTATNTTAPPAATATATQTTTPSGTCYPLYLSVSFAEGVEERPVGIAANIPNSAGCPSGEYKAGEQLFAAVSPPFTDIHPVWGASPPIALTCTHCEATGFTMPEGDLFLGTLYFNGPP